VTPPCTYVLYGLRIQSELPLHQNRQTDDGLPADVVLTMGATRPVPGDAPIGQRLAEVNDDNGTKYFTFVRADDGSYLLRYYRIGDFVVSADRSHVVMHLDPDADEELAAVLATGSLPAFLILAGGSPLLHASAVEISGQAVAFVGSSGMGKSMTATVMCAAGAKLVTDDVLRLEFDAGIVRCFLGATETRLRPSAAGLLGLFGDELKSRRTGDERDALELPASRTDKLPLAAIVVPQLVRDSTEVTMNRLTGIPALLTLTRFPRIVGWEETSVLEQQFEFLADVVRRVPVFLGYLPWGPPFPPDLAARIVAALDLSPEPAAAEVSRGGGRGMPLPAG
jgi:hypothetical protein